MHLSQAIVVLCRPDESRNIGSVCRSMLTMDISQLRIVGKKSDYNENHVNTLALHAKTVWEKALFFDSLYEATKDCAIIAGTTRRRGQKRKNALLLPEEFSQFVANISDNETKEKGLLAIVFGNERTGLTDAELEVCTMGVTIPTSSEFGSLNLSHAVQIIAYELFRANQKKSISPGYIPIPVYQLDKTIDTILNSLQSIGFFTQAGKKDMKLFWKNILSRSLLSKGESTYLEKIFTKLAGLHLKNKTDISSTNDII